jgi:hypothetical protein
VNFKTLTVYDDDDDDDDDGGGGGGGDDEDDDDNDVTFVCNTRPPHYVSSLLPDLGSVAGLCKNGV